MHSGFRVLADASESICSFIQKEKKYESICLSSNTDWKSIQRFSKSWSGTWTSSTRTGATPKELFPFIKTFYLGERGEKGILGSTLMALYFFFLL